MPGSLAQTQNMGSAQSKNPGRTKCKCGKGDTGNPDCVKATQEGRPASLGKRWLLVFNRKVRKDGRYKFL